MAKNFYRGIAFPFKKVGADLPAVAVDKDLIKQSLIQIVLTTRGERVMRPNLGTSLMSLVFENNDTIRAEILKADLISAISEYEDRVSVTNIEIRRSGSTVLVTINYIIVASQTEQKLSIGVPISTT